MIAIDTNILVRYITQDDLQQAEAAENLLAIYNNKPQSIFINNIVLCECIWGFSCFCGI
jgi:predicted nucleic-acid-binding protein